MKQLNDEFEMKDLGVAQRILGMDIIRDIRAGKVKLSQKAYIEKVLQRFNMSESKPATIPFASHFKLPVDLSPITEEEVEHMSSVPYSSAVHSIMYVMVCTGPDISHVVSIVSRYMACPGRQH